MGVPTAVLSPKETKELYPLMNVDNVYATLHSIGDYMCHCYTYFYCSPSTILFLIVALTIKNYQLLYYKFTSN